MRMNSKILDQNWVCECVLKVLIYNIYGADIKIQIIHMFCARKQKSLTRHDKRTGACLKIPFGPNLNLNTKISTEMNQKPRRTGIHESIPIIKWQKGCCRSLWGKDITAVSSILYLSLQSSGTLVLLLHCILHFCKKDGLYSKKPNTIQEVNLQENQLRETKHFYILDGRAEIVTQGALC